MLPKLKSLDIFGKTFSLHTNKGSGSYTTAIGGILSVFTLILFLIITLIVVSDYRDTTKPVVSVNRVKMPAPVRIDLFSNKIMSFFGVIEEKFVTIDEINRYLTFRIEMVTTTKNTNGYYEEKVELYEANIPEKLKNPQMKDLAFELILDKQFAQIDYMKLFADVGIVADINPEAFYISGSKFKLPYRRMRIRVFPCSTPNPADCVSLDTLSKSQFGNSITSKVGNYSSKRNPVLPFTDADNVIYLGVAQTVVISTYLKKNFIYDDDRGWFKDRLKFSYVDVDRIESRCKTRLNKRTHCSVAEIDSGVCEPYLEVIWRSSPEKMIIQRRYLTLFDVVSEVGGFLDLIRYGILSMYFYYNTRSYTRFVRGKLVDDFLEMSLKQPKEENHKKGNQIERVKTILMEKKLSIQYDQRDLGRLSVDEILKTKVDLESLSEFSFKSSLLIGVLFKEPIFDPLFLRIVFEKKRPKGKKRINLNTVLLGVREITQKKKLFKPRIEFSESIFPQSSERQMINKNSKRRKELSIGKNYQDRKKGRNQPRKQKDLKRRKGRSKAPLGLIVIDESVEFAEKRVEGEMPADKGALKKYKKREKKPKLQRKKNVPKSLVDFVISEEGESLSRKGEKSRKKITPLSLRRLSSRKIKSKDKLDLGHQRLKKENFIQSNLQ